jgi:hypothetical protein
MPGPSRVGVQARLVKGQSQDCAHSHHDRCQGGACTCKCHRDPEWLDRQRASAAKAVEARRAARETGAAETPPKRPDLKPGVKAAVPAAAARQIKSEFSLVLWGADNAAAKFAPQYWQTPEDRLADEERTQLVTAIYGELEARFPRALQVLARVGESAPEAMLLYTVAMIAAPRLARHGVIPNDLASAIVFAPLVLANLQQQTANGAAADVGAEPASQPDRPDGDWQEHTRIPPLEIPPVQAGAAVEAGRGDIRHGPGGANGQIDHGLPL